ncbi:MAG: Na+/H+ antiporter subunit E [Candidatus Thermoplasmatota archaeon]|nr:Na+/H+ antiporter subunit E [Candidatus Thermoplasmatota archaeon]
MITFLVLFVSMLLLYLLLVAGSGGGDGLLGQLFSYQEIGAAIVLAILTAAIARAMLGKAKNRVMNNPGKLLKAPFMFIVFLFPFFYAMAEANLDVAYRVITGRIRPGIVRIRPKLKTDLGRTMLANSITLTPGTLTVDIDEKSGDLFIHWINVKDTKTDDERIKAVCGSFPAWARRVVE